MTSKETHDMTHDTTNVRQDTRQMSPAHVTPGQLKALLVSLTIVLLVTFALSYKGLYDYGQRVAHFGVLSPLVPIGVDGGQICAIYAIHALRRMSYGKRLYAWIVFLLFAGSSVAANAAHALYQGYITAGVVGAAGTAAAGALLTHLVIFVKRHLQVTQDDTRQDIVPDMSQDMTHDKPLIGHLTNVRPAHDMTSDIGHDVRQDITEDTTRQLAAVPDTTNVTPTKVTTDKTMPPRKTLVSAAKLSTRHVTSRVRHDNRTQDKRQAALAKLSTGQLIKDVAEELGVDKRTVSRWKAAASKTLVSPSNHLVATR